MENFSVLPNFLSYFLNDQKKQAAIVRQSHWEKGA